MWFRRNGRRFAAAISALERWKQVALAVTVLHLVIAMILCIDHWLSFSVERHPTISVHTQEAPPLVLHLGANSPACAGKKSTVSQKKPSPKQAPAPQKVSSPARAAKKKGVQQVKKREKQPALSTETVQAINQSFQALSAKPMRKKSKDDLSVPATVALESTTYASVEEGAEGVSSLNYAETLVAYLHASLQLPEIGDVHIKMIIEAPGTIASLQVVEKQSEKNSRWLVEQLPLLELPCFLDFGIVENLLEFTIKFQNEERS